LKKQKEAQSDKMDVHKETKDEVKKQPEDDEKVPTKVSARQQKKAELKKLRVAKRKLKEINSIENAKETVITYSESLLTCEGRNAYT
jgi:hypothetical protein